MPSRSPSILGAVLSGGLSTRFGSDKALAILDGRRLLDHATDYLSTQCKTVIVVGRDGGIADWPGPHMGPLGGLAGALRHARATGYEAILSCAVDSIGLPPDLAQLFSPAPACAASQPVIGLWPVAALPVLEAILTGPGKHAVMRFVDMIGARRVDLPTEPTNVNRPEDLDALRNHME